MSPGGALSTNRIDDYSTIAVIVLCVYEHIITFSAEVTCIWRRPITGASVLFLINRYALLATALSSGSQALSASATINVKSFPATVYFRDVCLLLMSLTYAGFAALRMFAVYGLSKPIFALVLSVGLLNPCAQIVLMAVQDVQSAARMRACYNRLGHEAEEFPKTMLTAAMVYIFPFIRIQSIVFEGMLVVLTWKKTATRWAFTKVGMRTPYTTMLLRDGTLYFVVVEAITALHLGGSLLFSMNKPAGMIIASLCPIVEAMTSISMSRFILNLVTAKLDENGPGSRWSQMSSLRFSVVQTVVGNLGAPLSEGFVGGGNDCDELEHAEAEA